MTSFLSNREKFAKVRALQVVGRPNRQVLCCSSLCLHEVGDIGAQHQPNIAALDKIINTSIITTSNIEINLPTWGELRDIASDTAALSRGRRAMARSRTIGQVGGG